MKKILSIIFLLLFVSYNVYGAVTFSDTFTENSGDVELSLHTPDTGTGWTQLYNTITVIDSVDKAQGSSGAAEYLSDTPSVQNYTISVDVTIANGADTTNGNGVQFRYNNSGGRNGYLLRTRAGNNLLQLYRWDNNSPTLLDTISYTMNTSDVFTLAATVLTNGSGNVEISCTVDGSPQTWVTASDTTVVDSSANKKTTGDPGIYARNTGWYVDNYEINESDDTITLTSPVQYQMKQRDGSDQADIPITGTYTGTPTAIEADFNGGGYSTIDSSPSGNAFSGTLTNQSTGEGTLTVRFTNDTNVKDDVDDIRIGDIFFVMGQSNADGRLTNQQTYSGSVYGASQFDEDDNWEPLADPIFAAGYGSPWPLLGTLIENNEGVPVGFIGHATGGTSYYEDDWNPGDAEYLAAVAQWTDSEVNDVKAILFYLGENDALYGTTTFDTLTSTMLDSFQTATGTSSKMIVVLLGEYQSVPGSQIDEVRSDIIALWGNDADVLPGPPAHDQNQTDGVHWKTDAQGLILAQRWYRCIKYNYYSGSEVDRGPQLSALQIVDDQLINVVFTGGQGSLNDETDTEGWVVKDDGTPVGIDSVTRYSSSTIQIDVDTNLTGTVTVSYGLGNRSATIAWSDSGTYPFPPEPFAETEAVEISNVRSTYLKLLNLLQ